MPKQQTKKTGLKSEAKKTQSGGKADTDRMAEVAGAGGSASSSSYKMRGEVEAAVREVFRIVDEKGVSGLEKRKAVDSVCSQHLEKAERHANTLSARDVGEFGMLQCLMNKVCSDLDRQVEEEREARGDQLFGDEVDEGEDELYVPEDEHFSMEISNNRRDTLEEQGEGVDVAAILNEFLSIFASPTFPGKSEGGGRATERITSESPPRKKQRVGTPATSGPAKIVLPGETAHARRRWLISLVGNISRDLDLQVGPFENGDGLTSKFLEIATGSDDDDKNCFFCMASLGGDGEASAGGAKASTGTEYARLCLDALIAPACGHAVHLQCLAEFGTRNDRMDNPAYHGRCSLCKQKFRWTQSVAMDITRGCVRKILDDFCCRYEDTNGDPEAGEEPVPVEVADVVSDIITDLPETLGLSFIANDLDEKNFAVVDFFTSHGYDAEFDPSEREYRPLSEGFEARLRKAVVDDLKEKYHSNSQSESLLTHEESEESGETGDENMGQEGEDEILSVPSRR